MMQLPGNASPIFHTIASEFVVFFVVIAHVILSSDGGYRQQPRDDHPPQPMGSHFVELRPPVFCN